MTAKKRLIIRTTLISFLMLYTMSLLSCASGGLVVDASNLNANNPDAATVTVMRQKAFVGSGVKVEIYVDNELTAYLGSGDFVRFNARPGVHFIATRQGKFENVVRFFAEPNEKYYFYWGISTMGSVEQLTEKEANDIMSKDDFNDVTSND